MKKLMASQPAVQGQCLVANTHKRVSGFQIEQQLLKKIAPTNIEINVVFRVKWIGKKLKKTARLNWRQNKQQTKKIGFGKINYFSLNCGHLS
jgi:hypothetical protein